MSDESHARINDDFFAEVQGFEGTSDVQGSQWAMDNLGKKTFSDGKFLPYKDGEQWVIGYGTKIAEEEYDHYKEGITKEEANALLTDRLNTAKKHASSLVYNFTELSDDVKEVLTDLTFNMGVGTLEEDFPKFLNAIEDNDLPLAIAELKFQDPDSLGLKNTHEDDTGGKHSSYYESHKNRSTHNLDKLERAYNESLDSSTDDGVFNMLLDKDAFE